LAIILNIETSSEICSVALSINGKVTNLKESVENKTHASELSVFIEQILKEERISASSLDAVSVSKGPGSYTGLRIGVSMAKGICFAAGVPLIAISTLQAMAYKVIDIYNSGRFKDHHQAWFCAMTDARRMEVYLAVYDFQKNQVRNTASEVINKNSFIDILSGRNVLFFGPGSEKCKNMIIHNNAIFVSGIYPSAENMVSLSEDAFAKRQFADIISFEPFYFKDFIATVPKNKVNLPK
jgi:tRNA threonylcarbamoyladenosine biosynthesis protein TsaB